MGQTLSEPVTSKNSQKVENHLYSVGSSSMQGWRINMEDAHTHLLSLPEDKNCTFFAVYDGHGGAKVAHYSCKHLHTRIANQSDFKHGNIEAAIRKGYIEFDKEMSLDEDMREDLAGTTAICVLIKDQKLYCGNVGDSRAIASANGNVEILSVDHKPNNDDERKRITAAGGWVEFNRVNGNLALSRALGDFIFKRNTDKRPEEQVVTAAPDVVCKTITEDWEFILIACDGIWDVLSNEEVLKFVRVRVAQQMPPETICEELMTRCLAPNCQMGGLGCDNMTVVLCLLLHGQPYSTLAAKCSKNLANGDVSSSTSSAAAETSPAK
ncbi:unnamed protein product [Rotaria sordida]|uniref:protein-serine/threonine phosphatase n=2 Tax=Rotaria TaxID=231623 RepID=A0A814BFC2_9BILA|nr:unnamed protein product [Rotaria sordida]CAF0925294.1 unnamed protein product [Rotaria sordida]CAF0963065.1 unnamed protein product [Rotaria sordida]CAF3514412.1 unnamed protein product [Rotaria sordida]CAF3581448.1 unnamed protein product [Rotaria sordida]